MNDKLISNYLFFVILTIIPLVLGFLLFKIAEKFVKINQKFLIVLLFILEILGLFKFFFSLCQNCELGNSPLGYYLFYPVFVVPFVFFINYIIFKNFHAKLKYFLIIHFLIAYFIPSISLRFTEVQSIITILAVILPQILLSINCKIFKQ